MKLVLSLVILLSTLSAFGQGLEEQVQSLTRKMAKLEKLLANSKMFTKTRGGYVVEHAGTKVKLLDSGSIEIISAKTLDLRSFEHVRVHADAGIAAGALGAVAFTSGEGTKFKSKENIQMESQEGQLLVSVFDGISLKTNKGTAMLNSGQGKVRILNGGEVRVNTPLRFYVLSQNTKFQTDVAFNVKSTMMNLEGGAQTNIKGPLVRINNGGKPVARPGDLIQILSPGHGVIGPMPGGHTFLVP